MFNSKASNGFLVCCPNDAALSRTKLPVRHDEQGQSSLDQLTGAMVMKPHWCLSETSAFNRPWDGRLSLDLPSKPLPLSQPMAPNASNVTL